MTYKTTIFGAFIGLMFLAVSPAANAVTILNTCTNSDLTPTAVACVGKITDPVNDFQNPLAVNTLNLFGFNDWQALARDADPSVGVNPAQYSFSTSLNQLSGTWSVAAGSLSSFSSFLLVFKAGNGWTAYHYTDTSINGGTFDLSSWTKNGLSHATLYARGTGGHVPEPGILGLLGLGLVGLGLMARRRKPQ